VMNDHADLAPVSGHGRLPLQFREAPRKFAKRARALFEALGKRVRTPIR